MSLTIKNLSVAIGDKNILSGVNLEVFAGKIHALMGPNGSGKSTLAATLMGDPGYNIKNPAPPAGGQGSKIKINDKEITGLKPDERGRTGLFLAFQNPIAVPGVSVANLLKTAYQLQKNQKSKFKKQKKTHNPALSVWEFNEMLVKKARELSIPQEFLRKSLNEEFSGGEKKKLEMLQALVLSPKYAIFDEIDTGLDVDALKIVASGISRLKKEGSGILIITHYLRILKYVRPDFVHVLVKGKMVESGNYKLAEEIEKKGYKKWMK